MCTGKMNINVSPLTMPQTESFQEPQLKSKEDKELNDHSSDPSFETSKYKPIPYFSNYYPIIDTREQYKRNNNNLYAQTNYFNNTSLLGKDNVLFSKRHHSTGSNKRTEYLLKKYYETKRSTFDNSFSGSDHNSSFHQTYDNSVVDGISNSNNKVDNNTSHNNSASNIINKPDLQNSQKERNMSLLYINEFLKSSPDELCNSFIDSKFNPISNPSIISTDPIQLNNQIPCNTKSISSYLKYMEQLRTVMDTDNSEINKRRLWVPMHNKNVQKNVTEPKIVDSENILCPSSKPFISMDFNNIPKDDNTTIINSSTLTGENYIVNLYGPYSGIMSSPSIYAENKLPSFIYHCSVAIDDEIFIFGGLVPSYGYNEEAPNLNDFDVHGIKYLPPPLLDEVLNNPCMIANPFVYIVTTTTNHVRRAPLLGQLLPNLICATATMLNKRYVFLFGGIEVKTKTNFNPITGKYSIEKKAFVNNIGYIFDTKTSYFTKIEILLDGDSSNLGTITNFAPRFGHAQVSIDFNDSCNCSTNSSLSSSYENGNGNETLRSSPSSHHQISSILIFGGYRQIGHKECVATNDLWRIDIPITMLNKRDSIKFGTTATAHLIMDENKSGSMKLPPKRAFMGYSLMNRVPYSNNINVEKSTFMNLANVLKTVDIKEKHDEDDSITKINRDCDLLEGSKSTFSEGTSQRKNKKITQQASFGNNEDHIQTNENYLKSNESNLLFNNCFYKNLDNPNTCKTFLIHGGSNNTNVYSDLWWFNFNSYRWENMDLYGKAKCTNDQDSSLVPIKVGLVGHSLSVNCGVLSLDGGLNKNDVDILYNNKNIELNPKISLYDDTIKLDNLSSKCFDLSTQCLFDRKIVHYCDDDLESNSITVNVVLPFDHYMPTFFGTNGVYANGKLVIIGGIYCKRKKIKKLYLRGTMLYAIPMRYDPS